MIKSNSLFQKLYNIFENWDEEAFRNHHHEDFMHLQETDVLNRDEHVKVISELATKPGWNWHKIAKCIYEDKYCNIIRWEDNGEIVTHVSTIKNDQVWRAVISRVPKASSDQ